MSVKPSWLVTKLIEALGRPAGPTEDVLAARPAGWRGPGGCGVAPRQVSRTVLRNRSFHSRPRRREPAEVVAVGRGVPRLGDQLQLREHRVGRHLGEERRGEVHAVVTPAAAWWPGRSGSRPRAARRPSSAGPPAPAPGAPALRRSTVWRQPVVSSYEPSGAVPVPPGVVPAAAADRRTAVVVLAGVVEDDVDDHLEPGVVERAHHRLALVYLLAPVTRCVARVRCEPGDGVVAPEVAQATRPEGAAVHEVRHREQLDRRHPEVEEVVDHGGVGQTEVGATQVGGHVGVAGGHRPHVGLVDHGVGHRGARQPVAGPVEGRVDDHRPGHRRPRVPRRVGEARRAPSRRRRPPHGPLGPAAAGSGCAAGRGPGTRTGRPGAAARSPSPTSPFDPWCRSARHSSPCSSSPHSSTRSSSSGPAPSARLRTRPSGPRSGQPPARSPWIRRSSRGRERSISSPSTRSSTGPQSPPP